MEESLNMVDLIDKNKNSKNYNSIMDEMSTLKVEMNVFKDLIETKKSASKMKEDKMPLLRQQLLATTSNEWSPNCSTLRTAHQDKKKINLITIQNIQLCALHILRSKVII